MTKTVWRLFLIIAICITNCEETRGQSTIKGSVLGHDGKPLKQNVVLMTVGGVEENTITISPAEDGSFQYKTNLKGLHFLNFVGLHHVQQKVVLYISEPRDIQLSVRLNPLDYREDLSSAELRGRTGKETFYGKRFERQPDGTLAVEFATDTPSIQYLIIKATESGEPVPGTNADDYVIEAYGGIFALIYGINNAVDGKVKVALDPRNITADHRSTTPFENVESLDAKLTQIYDDINNQNKHGRPDHEKVRHLATQISNETNKTLRNALQIKYLNLLFPYAGWNVDVPEDLIDPEMITIALDDLTPQSPFWMLRWLAPDDLIMRAVAATGQPGRYKQYSEESIETWPYGIRGWGFSGLMAKALEKGDVKEMERLYARLQDLSPESPGGKFERLQRERKAARKVITGSQVPPFRAYSLGDTTVVYTHENIKARLYLIDFWATWCGPCYREFPYLHQAYDEFRSKGFEILSYALDPVTDAIIRSRNGKFPMPWLHAIDPKFRTNQSEMVKQFEVYGIPACFLVDASGKILATTDDLRGAKLLDVLRKYFKE